MARATVIAVTVALLWTAGAAAAEKPKKAVPAPPPPAAAPVVAAPPPANSADMVDGTAYKYDEAAARDLNRVCAACHGEFGEGGGGGVYPRLAGLNKDYLAEQVRKFKSRERENIPMIPFANERELPERDVRDITTYLSGITLTTKPPREDEPMDAHARLMKMKQVIQIPREPGDILVGKKLYDADCAECHGKQGQGRVKKPPLALQHMKYLRAQIELFFTGRRNHEDFDELMKGKTAEDWKNIYAHISLMGRD
jgi:cytochrome c553